jgi:hypothetical protein
LFIPLFLLFIGTIFFINADFFSLKNIEFHGNKNVDIEVLKEKINLELEKKYSKIYSKNNFLFYPKSLIEKIILENKKIKTVDISYKNFYSDIEIDITEKEAEFLYCIKNDKCFFMEKNGEIFTEFNQGEVEKNKKDFFIFFENTEKKSFFLGEQNFLEIQKLISDMNSINLNVEKIEKKDFNEFIIYLGSGTKIVFSLNQNYLKITESLKKISSKKSLKINKEKKSFSSDVMYINVSNGENIFYCLRGDGCEENY